MNEYYENGPEGMPRVERMTDSTIMAVLSQKNVPTIYVHSEQDYASLRLFAHAIAEETLARVPSWPAERTTSPVSGLTDEQQRQVEKCLRDGAIMGSVSDSTVDVVRAILAAAAPHAQAPAAPVAEQQTVRGDAADPAPIYKYHDDGKVTLTNVDKMPSYAAQPQPAAGQRVDDIVTAMYRRFKDWSKRGFGPDDVTWCEAKADVMALIAASQQAPDDRRIADTVNAARDIAIKFHDHQSLRERLAAVLVPVLRASQQAAETKGYCYYCSEGYSHSCPAHKPASPAIQPPQDERAAFEALELARGADLYRNEDGSYHVPRVRARWEGWQARAALAKKGGAA